MEGWVGLVGWPIAPNNVNNNEATQQSEQSVLRMS